MRKYRLDIPFYVQTSVFRTYWRAVEACSCCGHTLKAEKAQLTDAELDQEIASRHVELAKDLRRRLAEEGIEGYRINYYQSDLTDDVINVRAQAMDRKTGKPIMIPTDASKP